jgi:CDP-diacylglycerol--glycerol-3-phosphate 3-phosphatidyltransferase
MKREFFTLPNLLSLSRIALLIPFVLVLMSSLPSARLLACLVLVLGAITDNLDGLIARKRGQESEWGRILDPLADKIGVGGVVLMLLWSGDMPLWFAMSVLARDVLILVGGIVLKAKRGVVAPSNQVGKWSVGMIAAILFLLVAVGQGVVTQVLMGVTLVMLAYSLFLYARRFLVVLRNSQEPS